MSSEAFRLRKAFLTETRAFTGRSSIAGAALIVVGNLLAALLVALLSFNLFSYHIALAVPFYAAAVFFIGTRYRAFNNIIHECTHYAFTRDRNWNTRYGKLLAIPLFTSYHLYRDKHYSHHQHLGDEDKDLDFAGIKRFHFSDMITRLVVIRHVLTTITLRHVPVYISRVFYVREDGIFYNAARAAYLVGIVATPFVFGWLSAPTLFLVGYVLLPYATTFQIINYWQDALDHAGVIVNDDELYQSRNSVVENRLIRATLFPRNDCYHLVHHLFPQVAVADLPALHRLLLRDEAYAALEHNMAHRTLAFLSSSEGLLMPDSSGRAH